MVMKKNKYLGKLCKYGHDYQNTGKSLRYLKPGHKCVECVNTRCESYRQTYKHKRTIYDSQRRNGPKRELVLLSKKLYRVKNPEKIAKSKKSSVLKNTNHYKTYRKFYYSDSKNKTKRNIHNKERRQTDINYKLEQSFRSSTHKILKGINKSAHTMILLGCTINHFRSYIESLFKPGMSWSNYGYGPGKWVADHKIPCAVFNLTDPNQQKICFNWRNFQPLWYKENEEKHDHLWGYGQH